MEQGTPKAECVSIRPRDVLTDILRRGAQERLATAIENEVAEYVERHAASREFYPQTQEQCCWVHKTANVLDKMSKSLHAKAKAMRHDLRMAPSRQEASKAFDLFVQMFEAKYPKAVEWMVSRRSPLES
jgi:putative transposase